MSKLLEILGRGIAVNTAELMWHWIDTVTRDNPDIEKIGKIADKDGFIALKITGRNGTQYIFNSDCDYRRFSADGIDFEGSYAVVSLQSNGRLDYIYLGKGRYIQAAGFSIEGRDNMISSGVNLVKDGISISTDQPVRFAVPVKKGRDSKIRLRNADKVSMPPVNYKQADGDGFTASFNVEKCSNMNVEIVN
jgi:hypothetical protein